MYYFSLNNHDHKVTFEQAVVASLAADSGLSSQL
jgi:threonine synthase